MVTIVGEDKIKSEETNTEISRYWRKLVEEDESYRNQWWSGEGIAVREREIRKLS